MSRRTPPACALQHDADNLQDRKGRQRRDDEDQLHGVPVAQEDCAEQQRVAGAARREITAVVAQPPEHLGRPSGCAGVLCRRRFLREQHLPHVVHTGDRLAGERRPRNDPRYPPPETVERSRCSRGFSRVRAPGTPRVKTLRFGTPPPERPMPTVSSGKPIGCAGLVEGSRAFSPSECRRARPRPRSSASG